MHSTWLASARIKLDLEEKITWGSPSKLEEEPPAMDKPDILHVASAYETQSEGELLAPCEPSTEQEDTNTVVEMVVKNEDTGDSPQAAKKTGRAKRKEKRLKNEPQNITGKHHTLLHSTKPTRCQV